MSEEGLALFRKVGGQADIGLALSTLGYAEVQRNDLERAAALAEAAIALQRASGDATGVARSVSILGFVALARLWGAAEALREAVNISLAPIELSYYGPYLTTGRSQAGEETWEAAWSEGRQMTPEQAIEYALEEPKTPRETEPPTAYPAGLSAREVEVLRLVARGMTNAQIAKALFISPRTVNAHMGSIYHKIGSSTRAEAARFATEHGLL